MLNRVVLIFPDTESLATFIEYWQLPGEISGTDLSFVGDLNEEQIRIASLLFDAYVKLMQKR